MKKIFARSFTEIELINKENENVDKPEKSGIYYVRNFYQVSQNKSEYNLCRPIIFCEYEAYENCANKSFSTCENCR